MGIQTIFVDEQTHYLSQFTAGGAMVGKICPLSKREITANERVTLVANNFLHFPNKIVLTEELEKTTPEDAIRYLCIRYQEYLALSEGYKEWS